MGKLRDIINNRSKGQNIEYNLNVEDMATPKPSEATTNIDTKNLLYYNRTWLSKVVLQRRYAINTDNKKVDGILAALNRKNGHCPCGGSGIQFKCPCKNMRDLGICKCGLFLNIPDRKIGNTSSGGRIE